jgi:hypothetical protein
MSAKAFLPRGNQMFKAEIETAILAYKAITSRKSRRETTNVLDEYSAGWRAYHDTLARCDTLDEWLSANSRSVAWQTIDRRMVFAVADLGDYNRRTLVDAIRDYFPQPGSISGFGCGVGRNLLYVKSIFPSADVFGYELCQEGVDVARAAAEKFKMDVKYERLDYLTMEAGGPLFPAADVSFTCFSLEQLPKGADIALTNILARSKFGSAHIEPVTTNYPLTFRGIIGRLDHWKAGYLKGFTAAARRCGVTVAHCEQLPNSHNPLMFPSLYVLKK